MSVRLLRSGYRTRVQTLSYWHLAWEGEHMGWCELNTFWHQTADVMSWPQTTSFLSLSSLSRNTLLFLTDIKLTWSLSGMMDVDRSSPLNPPTCHSPLLHHHVRLHLTDCRVSVKGERSQEKRVCCVDVKKKKTYLATNGSRITWQLPKCFFFWLFLLYAFCVRRFFPSVSPPVCPQASISNPSPPAMSVGMYLQFSFFPTSSFFTTTWPLARTLARYAISRF